MVPGIPCDTCAPGGCPPANCPRRWHSELSTGLPTASRHLQSSICTRITPFHVRGTSPPREALPGLSANDCPVNRAMLPRAVKIRIRIFAFASELYENVNLGEWEEQDRGELSIASMGTHGRILYLSRDVIRNPGPPAKVRRFAHGPRPGRIAQIMFVQPGWVIERSATQGSQDRAGAKVLGAWWVLMRLQYWQLRRIQARDASDQPESGTSGAGQDHADDENRGAGGGPNNQYAHSETSSVGLVGKMQKAVQFPTVASQAAPATPPCPENQTASSGISDQ